MGSLQKILLSLLISVVVGAGFSVFAFSGFFSYLEAAFYDNRVERETVEQLADVNGGIETYHGTLLERFSLFLEEPAVRNAFMVNQSRQDILERENLLGALEEQLPELEYVRFVGIEDGDLWFSSLESDISAREATRIVYEPSEELEVPLPNRADMFGEQPLFPRPESNTFVYTLGITDNFGIERGRALFTVHTSGLRGYLIRQDLIRANQQVALLSGETLLVNARRYFQDSTYDRLSEALESEAEYPSIATESQEAFVIFSREGPYGIDSAFLVPAGNFQLSPLLQGVLLAAVFFSTLLLVHLLLNIRQDPAVVLSERVRRFQAEVIREMIKEGGVQNRGLLQQQLERRKEELDKRIRKGLGRVRKEKKEELQEIVDTNWKELGRLFAPQTAAQAQLEDVSLSKIEEIIDRTVRRYSIGGGEAAGTRTIPPARSGSGPAPGSSGPAVPPPPEGAASGKPTPPSATPAEEPEEALEPIEEAEAVEEVEEVPEAEAVEEIEEVPEAEAVEEVEELEEELEPVEEAEAVEEVEEVPEAEAVEEIPEAEAGEESEALEEQLPEIVVEDDVVSLERIDEEKAQELASTETELPEEVEPVEASGQEAEPADQAESTEELESARELESAEELEELEELDELESGPSGIEVELPQRLEEAAIAEAPVETPLERQERETFTEEREVSPFVGAMEREEVEMSPLEAAELYSDSPEGQGPEEEELEEIGELQDLSELEELEEEPPAELEGEAAPEGVEELEEIAPEQAVTEEPELEELTPPEELLPEEERFPEELQETEPVSEYLEETEELPEGPETEVEPVEEGPQSLFFSGLSFGARLSSPKAGTSGPTGAGESRRPAHVEVIRGQEFIRVEPGATSSAYELTGYDDLLEDVFSESSIINEEGGLPSIENAAFVEPEDRTMLDRRFKGLVSDVLHKYSDSVGVSSLFGGIDALFMDEEERTEGESETGATGPEVIGARRVHDAFTKDGFDIDRLVRRRGDSTGGLYRTLIELTRSWRARTCALLQQGENGFRAGVTLGLEESWREALSLSGDSNLGSEVLTRRMVLHTRLPLNRFVDFSESIRYEEASGAQEAFFIPARYNHQDAYLMIGYDIEIPDMTNFVRRFINAPSKR